MQNKEFMNLSKENEKWLKIGGAIISLLPVAYVGTLIFPEFEKVVLHEIQKTGSYKDITNLVVAIKNENPKDLEMIGASPKIISQIPNTFPNPSIGPTALLAKEIGIHGKENIIGYLKSLGLDEVAIHRLLDALVMSEGNSNDY